jgi:hypothetical protein
MYKTTAFVTADGKVFTDHRDAKRHAEARYADAMLPLARDICILGKYVATAEYIDKNLKRFVELAKLKADIELSARDDC